MRSVGKTSLSGETPLLFSFSGDFCRELDKLSHVGASQVALVVKNPPAMQEPQETWVGKVSWRRAWQPTPVFLPGESRGQRNLVGYSPWAHTTVDYN